jgi:hypothetical protein
MYEGDFREDKVGLSSSNLLNMVCVCVCVCVCVRACIICTQEH